MKSKLTIAMCLMLAACSNNKSVSKTIAMKQKPDTVTTIVTKESYLRIINGDSCYVYNDGSYGIVIRKKEADSVREQRRLNKIKSLTKEL